MSGIVVKAVALDDGGDAWQVFDGSELLCVTDVHDHARRIAVALALVPDPA